LQLCCGVETYEEFCEGPGCESTCGDGVVDPGNGEECDPGSGEGPNLICLIIGGGEGFCTAGCECLPAGFCGDGILGNSWIGPGEVEECDDGNTASGDGCSAACRKEKVDCSDLGPGWQDSECLPDECEERSPLPRREGERRPKTCYRCSPPELEGGNCGCGDQEATPERDNDTLLCGGGCVANGSDGTRDTQRQCRYVCQGDASLKRGGQGGTTVWCCACKKSQENDQCQPTTCLPEGSIEQEKATNCIDLNQYNCATCTKGKAVDCFCGLRATENPSALVCTQVV